MELYDSIGHGYGERRKQDPRIAERITWALGSSESVVNVGAGTGSYEPRDRKLVAVEPSMVMIQQRPADWHSRWVGRWYWGRGSTRSTTWCYWERVNETTTAAAPRNTARSGRTTGSGCLGVSCPECIEVFGFSSSDL